MPGSQASSSTIGKEEDALESSPKPRLRLEGFPPINVLDLHLTEEELHKAEDELVSSGAPVTYDLTEANIVLSRIVKQRRAKLELQWRNVRLDERDTRASDDVEVVTKDERNALSRKRRRLNSKAKPSAVKVEAASETEEDDTGAKPMSQLSISHAETASRVGISDSEDSHDSSPLVVDRNAYSGMVKVVKLEWLSDSLDIGKAQPFEPYVVYESKILPPLNPSSSVQKVSRIPMADPSIIAADGSTRFGENATLGIIERAKADPKPRYPRSDRRDRITDALREDLAGRSFLHAGGSQNQSFTKRTRLLHQTTSEHDEGISKVQPPMPDWVLQRKIYSCERATPLHSPNDDFLEQLKKIKLARELVGDQIGVRAYSTSIASIAAYPQVLTSTNEVLALPGCDEKIGQLFHEWLTCEGHIQAVAEIEADKVLAVLRQFFEIYGVGAKTAREFYYDRGWRDLDDIVENGWQSLSREQQVGLKYYDEFQIKMARSEVEAIAAVVKEHGRRMTDSGIECIIVGGYRRGKELCGDVDVILSHREEHQTYNLVDRVVQSLEQQGSITHMLVMNRTNSKRGQQPLPLAPMAGGHGFDTLDKALVVWQSQDWPTRSADLAANPKAKNPNPHRRVDIIISPWRTVGCAVAGWTSGTTFQRDLRRYAKKIKGWKFDSSGVRERGSGRWIDLERWSDPKTRAPTWQVAERRVFEGLGLEYMEPWDRCTG